MADQIVSVNPNRVDPTNEGRMVYLEGEVTVEGTLRDPLYGVEAKAGVLSRTVRTCGGIPAADTAPADYRMPVVYRADSRNCRLGAYRLRNVDEDSSFICIPLTEKNIPDSLKDRAQLASFWDGQPHEIHIQEADGTTTIISFSAVCAPPQHWALIVGRQCGEEVELGFTYFDTKEDYDALPYSRRRNPREYYRHLVYSLSDVCMKMLFAFSLATLSAYCCFYFTCKAFSGTLHHHTTGFILLSVFQTLAFFLWALWFMLERGIEYRGYHLQKAQQWIIFSKWGLAVSATCFGLTLLCLLLRRIRRRQEIGGN